MLSRPLPIRHSLRLRLPLLISVLIGVVLATFLWAAYRTLDATLVRTGASRAQVAARQVAQLLDARAAEERLRLLGVDPDLRQFLVTRSAGAREAARRRLAKLAPTGPRRIELWDETGTRLLSISVPDAAGRTLPPTSAPRGNRSAVFGPLQASADAVYYDAVVDIQSADPSPADGSSAPAALGYVVVRSAFTVSPPGIIGHLVGPDAIVKVGNRTGGVWTDFSNVVPAAPVQLVRNGIARYQHGDGEEYMGALEPVAGTPLAVWVEFPLSTIVAPARGVLARLLVLAGIFVLLGAGLAWAVSTRLTGPVADMSATADALAAGDYSRRVSVSRRDEIGRLAYAFNFMASEVQAAHDRLEARVSERTAQLAAARREAERANRAKNAFLSGMSHDLRTPLNAILGFAQLLELDAAETDRAEPVRQILSGGRHLLELITQVLDVTRIESGQITLSPEPVAVRESVQNAAELIKPLAAQRGIAVIVQPIPASDTVRADRQRLNQILLNLLSNAVKYNRPNGRIMVGVERVQPDRYRITVADTGPGIAESKRELLFQPFERLGAEQTAVEGTGLGLAHSRALAEAMGGAIGVRSIVDQGSTFWVELAETEPREEHEQPAVPGAAPARTAPSTSGLVLYLEDNTSNVRLVERILRQRPGIELRHAPDADTAFAMIADRRPDLMLLDLHLPGLSGEEVLQRLWADPASRSVPVVVVTADATPGLARRLKAAGATACLTKPLNVAEVLRLVDGLLSGSAEVDEYA